MLRFFASRFIVSSAGGHASRPGRGRGLMYDATAGHDHIHAAVARHAHLGHVQAHEFIPRS